MADTQKLFGFNYPQVNETDLQIAKELLPMLKPERFRDPYWIEVGKALYSADKGGNQGLSLWTEACRNAGCDMSCDKSYGEYKNSQITIKTLAWYAREDDPQSYGIWHTRWYKNAMERALSGYDTDIALALYRRYWLDFMYCSRQIKWFQYKNSWTESHQALEFRKCISQDFVRHFERFHIDLCEQDVRFLDKESKLRLEVVLDQLTELIGKLKNATFKTKLVDEACEYFDNKDVLFNDNPRLTGTTNGVIELSGSTFHFRKVKPEDYISAGVKSVYNVNYTWNHILVQTCMKWVNQALGDVSDYFLKRISDCVFRNDKKFVDLWTGPGSNTKSTLMRLVSFFVLPHQKILVLEESGTHLTLDDILKSFNLTDRKIIMINNILPMTFGVDSDMKSELRVIPFTGTWVQNPPVTEDEQYAKKRFKIDHHFGNRLDELAPAFLWILTQYLNKDDIPEPEQVSVRTEAYWRDNDIYSLFAINNVEPVYNQGKPDSQSRVTLNEIYTSFQYWYRDTFPGYPIPDKLLLRNELTKRWGPLFKNAWHGLRLI